MQVSTQTTVRKVTRDPAGGFFVDTEKEGIVARSHTDKVVLASPIEFLDIEFVNLTLAPVQPRKFEHWYLHYFLCTDMPCAPTHELCHEHTPEVLQERPLMIVAL